MAVRTSAQAGLWSAPSTWVGGLAPADLDTVTLLHSVIYNADNSAWTNGFGNVTIGANGQLLASTTPGNYVMKMKGYITQTATPLSPAIQVGTSTSTPYPADCVFTILMNGATYSINSVSNPIKLFKADPTNIYCAVVHQEPSGTSQLHIDRDLTGDLYWKVGSVIRICNINKNYGVQERIISAIDSNSITVSAALTSTILTGAEIFVINRNVRIVCPASPATQGAFNACGNKTNEIYAEISGGFSGDVFSGANFGKSGSVVSIIGTNYYAYPNFVDMELMPNSVCIGNSGGSAVKHSGPQSTRNARVRGYFGGYSTAYSSPYGVLIENCHFVGNSACMSTGRGNIVINSEFVGNGSGISMGDGNRVANCTFTGNGYGVGYESNAVIANCTFTGGTSGLDTVDGSAYDCMFSNNSKDLNASIALNLYRCSLNSTTQSTGNPSSSTPYCGIAQAWDIGNIAGAFKSWAYNGSIISDDTTPIGALSWAYKAAFLSQSADIYWQKALKVDKSDPITVTVYAKKTVSGASVITLPIFTLFNELTDPLMGFTPIGTWTMVDDLNEQSHTFTYTPSISATLILRMTAQLSGGNVFFNDIETVSEPEAVATGIRPYFSIQGL